MSMQPRRPDLAGTCRSAVEGIVAQDPSLTAVTGWYIDPFWGPREHWWATKPDGTIVDPTVEQFPSGHIPELRTYEVFSGEWSCEVCGISMRIEIGGDPVCCGACYGSMVGIYAGPCECGDRLAEVGLTEKNTEKEKNR